MGPERMAGKKLTNRAYSGKEASVSPPPIGVDETAGDGKGIKGDAQGLDEGGEGEGGQAGPGQENGEDRPGELQILKQEEDPEIKQQPRRQQGPSMGLLPLHPPGQQVIDPDGQHQQGEKVRRGEQIKAPAHPQQKEVPPAGGQKLVRQGRPGQQKEIGKGRGRHGRGSPAFKEDGGRAVPP